MISKDWKISLLTLVPILAGILVTHTYVGRLWYTTPIGFTVIFVIFWIWTGAKFASLDTGKLKSFLIGNSLLLASLLVYVWIYFLMPGESNMLVLIISQYYAVPLAYLGKLLVVATGNFFGNAYTLVPYLLMIVFFSVGFLYRTYRGTGRQEEEVTTEEALLESAGEEGTGSN